MQSATQNAAVIGATLSCLFCAQTVAQVNYGESNNFPVDTHLSTGTPSHADSTDFNVNTALTAETLAHDDSAPALLNTTRINRAWGDSEAFSLDVPQAPPSLNFATPQCDGITPGITLAWTAVPNATNYDIFRNNTLIFTTQTASTTFWNVSGLSAGATYTYRIRARFTGGGVSLLSNPVSAVAPTCQIPPPQSQPPTGQYVPTNTVTLDHLWQWSDTLQRFVRPPNNTVTITTSEPTYILTHGWDGDLDGNDDSNNTCMSPEYAMRAIGCAIREARPTANILAWDWQELANPNDTCDYPDGITENILSILRQPNIQYATFFASFYSTSLYIDIRRSAANSAVQGQILGASLAYELIRHQGSLGTELHLIGYSHGGGVMGRAAEQMTNFGHPPDSLITLDTPKVACVDVTFYGVRIKGCLVDSLQYVKPGTAGRIAIFHYQDAWSGFGAPVVASSYSGLTNVQLNRDLFTGFAHTWIRGSNDAGCPADDGWYNQAIWDPGNVPAGPIPLYFDGVQVPSVLSTAQFQDGCYDEQAVGHFTSTPCPPFLRTEVEPDSETPGLALLAHETFEDASSWTGTNVQVMIGADPADADNSTILIDEQGDSSFFKDIAWPNKAIEITFDYMFRDPRGDESLTVYLNDEIIYYDNAAISLALGQLRSSEAIYVGQAADTTARFTFVLRTDNTPGGSLVLDNLRTWGFLPGDMTGDGKLDGQDVAPFITVVLAASTDPGDLYIADLTADGVVDEQDIAPFVARLLLD